MNQNRKIAAYLIVQNLPNVKEPIPVYFGENSFGRNPLKADVCLPDASISEKHAKIVINQQIFTLTDIGSKNGTFLTNQHTKLQKNLSCSIEQNQIIFFAEIKCHFVKVKTNEQKKELSDTEFQEQEQKKIQFQKKLQKQKKTKVLDPKKNKQQKKPSPLKIQQNQTTKQPKNQEKLKGVNKINKNKQQKVKNIDKKIQNQSKAHSEQKVTNKQTKNTKKIIQEKTIQNNNSKQKSQKIVNQSKNIKQKNSKEKKQTKDKLPEKNGKLSKPTKQISQHKDTKIKNKNQQPKQSRKRVPSQQAVYERISITRRRVNICTKFMISGFSLTFLTHQQLKLIDNYQQDFNVLVMEKYCRTFKLLYSISRGIPIVTKDWLLQSQYYKKVMPFQHYLLCIPQDKSLIKKSIEKVNEGFRLLTNSKFYLACPEEKYHLKVSEIQKLIYSMDGQVIQAINASKDQKTKNLLKNAFIILSRQFSKEDLQRARGLNKDNIYTIQLILQGCLKQQLDLKAHKIQ